MFLLVQAVSISVRARIHVPCPRRQKPSPHLKFKRKSMKAICRARGIQERNYKIEGKTLSVSTTPTLVNGKEQVGYLIFERV